MHENELRNRIWELTVENERLERCYEEDRRTIARLLEYTRIKDEELISAKASVGAVIEQAAKACIECAPDPANGPFSGTNNMRVIAFDCRDKVRAINPDATAALNEMLADVWDEGYTSGYHGRGRHTNPYRKEKK